MNWKSKLNQRGQIMFFLKSHKSVYNTFMGYVNEVIKEDIIVNVMMKNSIELTNYCKVLNLTSKNVCVSVTTYNDGFVKLSFKPVK